MKISHIAMILLMLVSKSISKAQDIHGAIKGRIIENITKAPLIGATILLNSSNRGTVTDTTGAFVLNNIPEGIYQLKISYIGFQGKMVEDVQVFSGKTTYKDFELIEDRNLIKDVVVTAYRYENNPLTPISTYSFSKEEIFRTPGSQGDIFRVIGILPGVSSSGGQFSAIAVRGQATRDNVYMIDDIPMFEVSHLEGNASGFNDPNGGRSSIFAPRTIENAVFQGGGFAAQYGRKSASYLGLTIKEGNKESRFLSGQFDLMGPTLIYDGPLNKKINLFATARYQHFQLAQKVVGIEEKGLPIYADFLVKATTQLTKSTKLSFVAMYNPETYVRTMKHQMIAEKVENTDAIDYTNNKGMAGINLVTLGNRSNWKNIAYFRYFSNDINLGYFYPKFDVSDNITNKGSIQYQANVKGISNTQTELGYRSIFTKNLAWGTFVTGFDLASVNIDYARMLNRVDTLYTFYRNEPRLSQNNYTIINPKDFNATYKKSAFNASAYVDVSFTVLEKLSLNTGIRYDHSGLTDANDISPRISGSYQLNSSSSFNFSSGIFYQDPLNNDIADQGEMKKLKSEKVVQYIVGYKNYFRSDLKLVIESWYKKMDNLLVRPLSGLPYLNNQGDGEAYGLDINITKRLSQKYHGQLAYSYMQSKRNDYKGQGVYDFAFSQPHIISFLMTYKPNDKWIFATKYRYATGRPKDVFIITNDVFNNKNVSRSTQEITQINGTRLNDYSSIDVRADYRVKWHKLMVTTFLDVVNITNRFNQSAEIFQPLTGKTYYDGLSIFPTFGLRVEL